MWRSIRLFFVSLRNLFNHFFKNDIVNALAIIIICISIALLLKFAGVLGIVTHPTAIIILDKIGDIIIASGFFAVILKALRLSNYFKEDLADVIYGKNFLTHTTEAFKEKAWKNVTDCLYESKFPELGGKINERIYREIIPDDLDRHHKDVNSYYTIKKLDNNHIEITHIDTYTIVSKEKKTKIKAEYLIEKSNDPADLTELTISSYLVGTNQLITEFDISPWMSKPSGNNLGRKFTLEKEVAVPDNGELVVKIEAKSILNKHLSLTWRKNFKLFTEGAEIFIENDNPNLIVDFQPFGNSQKYNEIGQPIGKDFKKNLETLFPGDGYTIFVTIK